jgi:hypothetical protein
MMGTEERLDEVAQKVEGRLVTFQEQFDRRIDTLRNVGLGAALATLLALLGILLPILYPEFTRNREAVQAHGRTVEDLKMDVKSLQQLREEVRRIGDQLERLQRTPPPPVQKRSQGLSNPAVQ